MSQLDLTKMKFQNVGRYVDEQEVDLSDLGQLNQIDGINHNTGGSSGAAKSTLLMVIGYVLGTEKKPATRLQSRLTKDKLWGLLEFRWKGTTLVLRRSRTDGLEIWETDPQTGVVAHHSKVAAEERLAQIVGVPMRVLGELVHKRQKGRGFFLSLPPKEKYELMMEILGLGPWKRKMETAEAKASELSKAQADLEGKIERLTTEAADRRAQLDALSPPQTQNYEMEIMRLQAEVASAEKDAAAVRVQYQGLINSLVAPTKKTSSADRTVYDGLTERMSALAGRVQATKVDFTAGLERLRAAKDKITADIKARDSLRDQARFVIADSGNQARKTYESLKHLREHSDCPTCHQHWVGPDKQSSIERLEADLQGYKAKLETAQETLATPSDLEGKLSQVETMIADKSAQCPWREDEAQWQTLSVERAREEQRIASQEQDVTYLERLNAHEAEKRALERTRDEEARKHQDRASRSALELREAETLEKAQKQAAAHYEGLKKTLAAAHATTEAALREAEGSREALSSSKAVVEDAARAMKSFTIQKFKESLDAVASHANAILAGVPNTRDSAVYFDSFKLQGNGAIKEEVTCYVSLDGEAGVPLDTLCGGEETAFELAIDLGFNEMVEIGSGVGISHYFMDEPFDGMDDACVAPLLEMLRGYKTNKKLVILSHAPAIKELAEKTILVERRGDFSNVTSIK
jgi:DNA repair exonuclease SbcCD ATPase subunit